MPTSSTPKTRGGSLGPLVAMEVINAVISSSHEFEIRVTMKSLHTALARSLDEEFLARNYPSDFTGTFVIVKRRGGSLAVFSKA